MSSVFRQMYSKDRLMSGVISRSTPMLKALVEGVRIGSCTPWKKPWAPVGSKPGKASKLITRPPRRGLGKGVKMKFAPGNAAFILASASSGESPDNSVMLSKFTVGGRLG